MNQKQMQAATDSMVDWLAHSSELGKTPTKIECVGSFMLHELRYYMFKYKKNFFSPWMLGVCGGYACDNDMEHCGHVFSEMEVFDPDCAEDDCVDMIEHIRAQWKLEAEAVQAAQQEEAGSGTEAAPAADTAEEAPEKSPENIPFAGFALLSDPSWDRDRVLTALREEWGLEVQVEDSKDVDLLFTCGTATAFVTLRSCPVPHGEAEQKAAGNYMWPGAVPAARNHQAHLMVAVLDRRADPVRYGQLFVKLMSVCAQQENVTALYTGDAVVEPAQYRKLASVMKDGHLPVLNWIWFQLYRNEHGVCCHTLGMNRFHKEEMELLDVDDRPAAVREFLVSVAVYVLSHNITLRHGDTVSVSDTERHVILRSEGVALPGTTLKISYQPL